MTRRSPRSGIRHAAELAADAALRRREAWEDTARRVAAMLELWRVTATLRLHTELRDSVARVLAAAQARAAAGDDAAAADAGFVAGELGELDADAGDLLERWRHAREAAGFTLRLDGAEPAPQDREALPPLDEVLAHATGSPELTALGAVHAELSVRAALARRCGVAGVDAALAGSERDLGELRAVVEHALRTAWRRARDARERAIGADEAAERAAARLEQAVHGYAAGGELVDVLEALFAREAAATARIADVAAYEDASFAVSRILGVPLSTADVVPLPAVGRAAASAG